MSAAGCRTPAPVERPATTTSAGADATAAEPGFVIHGATVFDGEHLVWKAGSLVPTPTPP